MFYITVIVLLYQRQNVLGPKKVILSPCFLKVPIYAQNEQTIDA